MLPGARIGNARARTAGLLHPQSEGSSHSRSSKEGRVKEGSLCAEPSSGAASHCGASYIHLLLTSLTPYSYMGKFPSHSSSQIHLSTRRNGTSGGFQSISRRLRGSFPQNHIHTLPCLPCTLLTKPNRIPAPRKTELLKMPFRDHLCTIFTFP